MFEDDYWHRIVAHKKEVGDVFLLCFTKVSICINPEDAENLLIESFQYLLDNASNTFHIKLSKCKRNEILVFYVTRNDFFLLEKLLNKYEHLMFTPMAFVPYRGKIAVGKDVSSWGSYNCQIHRNMR